MNLGLLDEKHERDHCAMPPPSSSSTTDASDATDAADATDASDVN